MYRSAERGFKQLGQGTVAMVILLSDEAVLGAHRRGRLVSAEAVALGSGNVGADKLGHEMNGGGAGGQRVRAENVLHVLADALDHGELGAGTRVPDLDGDGAVGVHRCIMSAFRAGVKMFHVKHHSIF
jgi:hypothetical protein